MYGSAARVRGGAMLRRALCKESKCRLAFRANSRVRYTSRTAVGVLGPMQAANLVTMPEQGLPRGWDIGADDDDGG